jgi:glycosyltransferase involved in cell wall biosynthesis
MTAHSVRNIHVIPSVSNEAMGPSYSVVRLCEALIDEGEDVTLAALDWLPMASAPTFLKRFPLGLGPKRLGRSPAMRRWLADKVANDGIDIIHNHSLWMMPNVYPGKISMAGSVPLVVSPRGTLSPWAMRYGSRFKRIFWPLVQRPAIKHAHCLHATAASEYLDIRRLGFRQPVAIIPNGIDVPDLVPKITSSSRTLLFLGRIHPVKGVNTLLQAWEAVMRRFPDWRLRVAGPDNGDYLAQMQRLAVSLNLERVEFVGALYGNAKVQAFREADLFVLPTHSENFGMAVAEALASGTPAIVTKGAPWEGLEKNQCGWWIDIGLDPLVAGLEAALAYSTDELAAMGCGGRQWMVKDYSWRQIGQKMDRTYRWLIDGGLPPDWVITN